MDFLHCMELDQAQDLIRRTIQGIVIGEEIVGLEDALGRVTAEEIPATEDLPPFSRSTVDGYAVRSSDTFGASDAAAAFLSIVGEVQMGQLAIGLVGPGQASIVPTGGMLPAGADAVVMVEHTEQPDSQTVLVQRAVAPGENIIQRGEDIACGTTIVEKGVRITPQLIGLLAACGCSRLLVKRKIKVAVLSSGDELVDVNEIPAMGQMRDVNSYSLSALLKALGCEVYRMGIVRDNYETFVSRLTDAVAQCQLVIISGGSSVGAKDFGVTAMAALGAPGILIHGLAIKPGKPTIFAMAGKVPIFGLPGHPVAALTVCGELVAAAIRQMSGQVASAEMGIPAILSRNIASAPGRDDFINVRLVRRDGGYVAEPVLGKSGLISIMAKADGLLHVPMEQSGLYEGDSVVIVPVVRQER